MKLNLFFKQQSDQFRVFNTNARKLITGNALYALFNPFFLLFSNTFIFSSTKGNIYFNMLYCMFTFAGILLGFLINGYWLRVTHVKKLLVIGAWFMYAATAVMFFVPPSAITGTFILIFGLFAGLGNGIYWSSRNYLTLVNTTDTNRNFFAGLDFILNSAGRVITPLAVGFYISEGVNMGLFTTHVAYQTTLIVAFIILFTMSVIILPRKYKTIQPNNFLHFKYSKIWSQVRIMTILIGLFQGALIALPPVLIMKYVGAEASVGAISSLGYILAIIIVYTVSKRTAAEHRTDISRYAYILFFCAAILYSVSLQFNTFWATVIFMLFMFILDPVINFPFRATFMKAIEMASPIDKYETYSYVIDIEFFAAFGRISGIILFYLLYKWLPLNFALPIFMLTIAMLQFLALPYSKKINEKGL